MLFITLDPNKQYTVTFLEESLAIHSKSVIKLELNQMLDD